MALSEEELRQLAAEIVNTQKRLNTMTDQLVRQVDKTSGAYADSEKEVRRGNNVLRNAYDGLVGFIQRAGSEATHPLQVGMDAVKTGLGLLGDSFKNASATSNGAYSQLSKTLGSGLTEKFKDVQKSLERVAGVAGDELVKALDVLGEQVMQNYNSFQTVQKSNILLGGGIQELATNAARSGVPIKAFTRGLQLARVDLANMGLGAGEGMNKLSGVVGELTTGSERYNIQLDALGYSTEEQMALVAQQMAIDRAAGLDKTKNEKQIAASAVQLAKDMKVLSDVTGEDAKKKMEEARKESMRAAVMANMSDEERLKFQKQYAMMPKALQQSYLEYVASGGQAVTNAAGAMMMASTETMPKMFAEAYAAQKNSAISVTQAGDMVLQGVKDLSDEQRQRNKENGTAAAVDRAVILGKVQGTAAEFAALSNEIAALQIGDVKLARQRAEQATDIEKMDPATKFATEAKALGESIQRETQNILNPALDEFTGSIKSAAGLIQASMQALRVGMKGQGLDVLQTPLYPDSNVQRVPGPVERPPVAFPGPATTPGRPAERPPVAFPGPATTPGTPVPPGPPKPRPEIKWPDKKQSSADSIYEPTVGLSKELVAALTSFSERPAVTAEEKMYYNDMRSMLREQIVLMRANADTSQELKTAMDNVYSRLDSLRA